jgi:hypothetical protein
MLFVQKTNSLYGINNALLFYFRLKMKEPAFTRVGPLEDLPASEGADSARKQLVFLYYSAYG